MLNKRDKKVLRHVVTFFWQLDNTGNWAKFLDDLFEVQTNNRKHFPRDFVAFQLLRKVITEDVAINALLRGIHVIQIRQSMIIDNARQHARFSRLLDEQTATRNAMLEELVGHFCDVAEFPKPGKQMKLCQPADDDSLDLSAGERALLHQFLETQLSPPTPDKHATLHSRLRELENNSGASLLDPVIQLILRKILTSNVIVQMVMATLADFDDRRRSLYEKPADRDCLKRNIAFWQKTLSNHLQQIARPL